MLNALTLLGVAVAVSGFGVVGYALASACRASIRWWGQRELPSGDGIWAGAIAEKDAYVPGTIWRKLGLVLAGLALAALGAPLIWAGMALGDFVRVGEPTRIARLYDAGEGMKLIVEPTARDSSVHPRPGRIVIANAEYIAFAAPLTTVGLGPYFRLTHFSGFPSRRSVLERTGGRRIDLAPPHPLFGYLERLSKAAPALVTVSRRMSRPMPDSSPAELWAAPFGGVGDGQEGLEWRR